jgi:hypothetical protein
MTTDEMVHPSFKQTQSKGNEKGSAEDDFLMNFEVCLNILTSCRVLG